MAQVSNPQPGNKYKAICADGQSPHKEVVFTFLNVTRDGRYEIEVDNERQIVSSFCSLCHPWTCEIHTF